MRNYFSSGYQASIKANNFFNKFSEEAVVFLLVLVVAVSSLKLNTGPGSSNDVEQWLNLTNQMFYGKQDLLFSYGPLFWLTGRTTSQYSSYTYWLTIIFSSGLSAYFWSIIFTLSYRARAYIFFAVAYFLFFNSLIFSSALFLWPFAAIVYLEFSKEKPIALGAKGLFIFGLLIGLSFYVRFFYGMVGLATFGSYLFHKLLEERKISRLIIFLASVATSYIISGLLIFHDRSSLINYFLINSQLNFGNSVDMTLDVTNSIHSFIAVSLVILFLNTYLALRKRSLLLTINALLLICFKIGFSRADHHIEYFVKPAAVLALVMIFDTSKLGRLLFVLVMGCLYFISAMPSYPNAPIHNSLTPQEDFKASYASRMQSVYTEFKLSPEVLDIIKDSSIDVYPYNNEYIFGNGLNYWHRPLFQNYMTLTPTLDSMNQKFFESQQRPRFVLWTAAIMCTTACCNPFDNIDQKLSLNEDPLTTSSILLNYHIVQKSKGKNGAPIVLLEENTGYTPYSSTPISEQVMKFGEWYKVPQSQHGVSKIIPRLNFTIYGRVKNLLFRGNILKIKYKLLTGEIVEYRLNILNSKNGVWVSPLLNSLEFSGPTIDSIMFESISPNYFQPTFTAEWINLPIPNIYTKNGMLDPIDTPPPAFSKEIQINCDGFIDSINGGPPAQSMTSNGVVKVQGWLALSAKGGTLIDKTFLTLTDHTGRRLFASTHGQDRKDVAQASGHPNLAAAGYEALIDLSGLTGNYQLGLAGIHGTELHTCSQYKIPLTLTHH